MSNNDMNLPPIKAAELDTTGSRINEQHFYGGVNMLIGDPYAKTTFSVGWEAFNQRGFNVPIEKFVIRINRKEDFYVTAIKNLRKKINFIALNNEYQNGDISDEDFEKEIEDNPQKYVVNVDNYCSNIDLEILEEVVTKVNEDFTIDELAEVFSIDVTGCSHQIQIVN